MNDNSSRRRMTSSEKAGVFAFFSFVVMVGSLAAGAWGVFIFFFLLTLVFALIHK